MPDSLAELNFIPYLDDRGYVPETYAGRVGVYAIYNQQKTLCYIGYSRDIATSLVQHLVRQPEQCYWVKIHTIDRPSRSVLDEIRASWIAEQGSIPKGNQADEPLWTQPIDTKPHMTDEEKATLEASDELGQIKLRKKVARRIEEQVLAQLAARGVLMPIRFDPKLKEEGLLNIK